MTRSGTGASHAADCSGDAAIYARVSTEDQGKGVSIPMELEATQQLAECTGATVPQGDVLVERDSSSAVVDHPG